MVLEVEILHGIYICAYILAEVLMDAIIHNILAADSASIIFEIIKNYCKSGMLLIYEYILINGHRIHRQWDVFVRCNQ